MDSHLAHLRTQLAEPLYHPDAVQLNAMTRQVTGWLLEHFTSLGEQRIGQTGSRAEMEVLLQEPAPEIGRDFTQVLDEFQRHVVPNAFRVNHPRFFAFVPSAPTYLSVLGDMLCAGTNFFAGVWLEAAGPAQVELVVLDWFKEFIGYPAEASGILTGGGSEANLTALVVAREGLLRADRDRAMLYVTEQRHWSVDRAAKVMGLRAERVRPVPTSADFSLDVAALADCIHNDRAGGLLPWAVVANAGATNTGAVDPLAALATLCRQERLWLHVDAAYGWPAVLVPKGKAMREGMALADSITLDPHKWFGQTFEAGCLMVREGKLLASTFGLRPDYMQDVEPAHDEVNFADHGIALTRRFRALKIWLSVKVLGVGWYRAMVERSCRLAELAEWLLRQSPQFEILSPRQLSIVCFRYVTTLDANTPGSPAHSDQQLNKLNLALVDQLRLTGRAFLSSTLLRGRVALRFCFVNWRTTAGDVEETIRLLTELGQAIESKYATLK